MSIFKRRPSRLARILAAHDLEVAMRRAESPPSFLDQCEHVRTPQGRKAHLRHPDYGVLCGSAGADQDARGLLEECRTCRARAEGISDERKAS